MPEDTVDFRRSLPPIPAGLHERLRDAAQSLAEQTDLGLLNHQSIPRGAESDRIAGAQWLTPRFGAPVPPERLIITNGAQSAILILLKRIVGSGGLLLAERLSYGALRGVARESGVHLRGIEIDAEGVVPEAFEAACRSARPKALYCNPTVHNPTTAVMSEARRMAIVEIARRHGVTLIEDDALSHLHLDAPRPIAAFAPELTWYVMTTTKCLSHGMRLAYLLMPDNPAANDVWSPVERLTYWHPAPLLAAIVTQWVTNGDAGEISRGIAQECLAREQAARGILSDFNLQSKPGSMHVWLGLPPKWNGAQFTAAAEARKVLLRPASLFAVDDQPAPDCVRLSLSTPSTLDEVRGGLATLQAMLDQGR